MIYWVDGANSAKIFKITQVLSLSLVLKFRIIPVVGKIPS